MIAPLAAAAPAGADAMPALLLALVAVIAATRLLGELAQRLGQPTVLGELVAGMLLGGSALGVLDPSQPVVHALSELGVLLLLFQIGLHTDLASLATVGAAASATGLVGVALPFGLGYAAATWLGLGAIPALVAGAALTATSIGISARVLGDLGRLQTPEGQVVLGAAVLDDVVGLIILSVVSGIVAGGGVTLAGVATTSAVAIGFVVAAIVLGAVAVRPIFAAAERLQAAGALGMTAVAVALAFAWAAHAAGSATIVGAFAAGLVLHRTRHRGTIEATAIGLGHFFVPIFFAAVGAAVDLRALADGPALRLGAVLAACGIAGKVAAGFAPWWFRGDKLLVGVAMVPRGEVGLIFAQLGLASGAIDAGTFGALMLMVLVTTFVTPPLLSRLAARAGPPQDPGGIDDLVAGRPTRH